VVVNVVRFSFFHAVFLLLLFSAMAFILGVAAGTSGQYREFVAWATASLSETSGLRRLALWPDHQAHGTLLISEQLSALDARVSEAFTSSAEQGRKLANDYRTQAERLLDFRERVLDTNNDCKSAFEQGNNAANYCYWTKQQIELLQATIASALKACEALHESEASTAPRQRRGGN